MPTTPFYSYFVQNEDYSWIILPTQPGSQIHITMYVASLIQIRDCRGACLSL